jgi:FG-GAP repeat protein/VCBS repeat protein
MNLARRVLALVAVMGTVAAPLRGQHLIGKFTGELTGDLFGKSVAMLGDVDGDGVCDFAVGSWHPTPTFEGGVYVYSGASRTLIRRIDGLQSYEKMGYSLAALGDVDGDGVPDLAIGAPWWFEPGGWDGGRVCVYSGATGSLVWYQPSQGSQCMLGYSIANVGDVDGDGVDDFAAGAPNLDTGAHIYAGAAYVFSGKTGSILYTWIGDEDLLGLGATVGFVGDADGDGTSDVAVTAGLGGMSGKNRGRVYLYSGKDGTLLQSWTGTIDSASFGRGLAPMGDLNGDGCADLAIGSWGASTDVFLYSGKDGVLIDTIHSGGVPQDAFGQALANAGDLDGDGFPELVVGAPQDSSLFTLGGSVYVFNGRTRRQLYKFEAEGANGLFGNAVSGGQDIDGDSIPDFLAGNDAAPKGRAYLFGGNELFLQADPTDPAPLTTLTLSTRAGVSGSLALMTLEDLDGTPLFQFLQLTTLDSNGEWIFSTKVPSGLTGHEVGLRTYAQKDPTKGGVISTDLAYVTFQ